MTRWLFILAGVAFAFPALSADPPAAVEPWSPPVWDGRRETPPLPHQREIGPDHADSQCIGDATTPLCAVETFIACWARRDIDLCRKVYDGPLRYFDTAGTQPYLFKYRLEVLYHPTGKELLEDRQPAWAAAGNVVVNITNAPMSKDDDVQGVRRIYLVEPTDHGWRIAYWIALPDLPAVIPDRPDARRIKRDEITMPGCAEDSTSPACVVERFISCQLRETPMCPGLRRITIPAGARRATAVEYWDIASYQFRPEDLSNEPFIENIYPRPGDIFFGTVEKWYVDGMLINDWRPKIYILRPTRQGWDLVYAVR